MWIWDKTALVTVQVSTRATASLFVLFVSMLVDTPMIVELELLFFSLDRKMSRRQGSCGARVF